MDRLILADTNILSTFAKIGRILLLLELFRSGGVGVTPAVYEEMQVGVTKGYVALQAVTILVQHGQIILVAPTVEEILYKNLLPASFDLGERETLAVARARSWGILTNENQVKHWCRREQVEYWDLPGILRALWRNRLMEKAQVQALIDEIEAKDRIVFRNKTQILTEG